MAYTHSFRCVAVCYDYRHPLCKTAFQDGGTFACTVRERCKTTHIDNNGDIQRRYIIRQTRIGRFLRHMVSAVQDDAPDTGTGERCAW